MKLFTVLTGLLTKHRILELHLDKAATVICTWHSQKAAAKQLEDAGFIIIYDDEPAPPYNNQVNRQARAILNGVNYAKAMGATHILRIRTDMYCNNLTKFNDLLLAKYDDNYKLAVLSGILIDLPHYYYLDILFFGRVEVFIDFFGIKQEPGDIRSPEIFWAETRLQCPANTSQDFRAIFNFFGLDCEQHAIDWFWYRLSHWKRINYTNEAYWY